MLRTMGIDHLTCCCVILACILIPGIFSGTVKYADDLIISQKQKEILDKFREIVLSRLPHDYMKRDIYLVRWLRAKRFDIEASETMFMRNLRWREENKMDTILNEEWSDLELNYPILMQGCDKIGRPVVSGQAGEWDVRGAILAGLYERGLRYVDRILEESVVIVRKAQERGENMTQFVAVIDMRHYSFVQHGCPLCVIMYAYAAQSYRDHYPGSAHRVIMINVPSAFLAAWTLIRSALPEDERNLLVLYGRDEHEWKTPLFKEIDPSELTIDFGGTNEEAVSQISDHFYRDNVSCEWMRHQRNIDKNGI
ncbi:SEC14-like protein 2 [Folsomia candida]|uniref:SEC14-like protein 2 n=1 Tax=Folsomia candida TaxID=158441 RepID=UPI001604C41F|nr:SEC14-like protein 2 [Folsomia candida]